MQRSMLKATSLYDGANKLIQCKFCKSGKTNLCGKVRTTQGQGKMPDGTSRFKCKGKELLHFMGCSTFSQYTVVSKYSVVKINEKAPLQKACLLGCGVTTGFGAATKSANVQEGETVAVFGIGCVGLAVLQGASFRKASRVIAIDTNDTKKDWAMKMGATEFINPTKLGEGKNITSHLVEITDGGLDHTLSVGMCFATYIAEIFSVDSDCTGNVNVMRSALEACHKGWGVSTIVCPFLSSSYYSNMITDRCRRSGTRNFHQTLPARHWTKMARIGFRWCQRQDRVRLCYLFLLC